MITANKSLALLTPKMTATGRRQWVSRGIEKITLFRDGERVRELVHRLVLTVFERSALGNEQACHRNGNPSINHIEICGGEARKTIGRIENAMAMAILMETVERSHRQ